MKHYKVKKFSSEAKKDNLLDSLLSETLDDFLNLGKLGQLKFALGAGLYKLRIATKEGKGKSGGIKKYIGF